MVEREVCERGGSSNWLVACERILQTNDDFLDQNAPHEPRDEPL